MFKRKNKIFCISLQRSGTTSVGKFFKSFNYNVADYDKSFSNKWTKSQFDGDYDKIFKSRDFKKNQVFEDNPWWSPDFYKFLYHKFNDSKFILLTRPADDWFNSMVKHSGGKTLGNTEIHCKLYRREKEYQTLISSIKIQNKDYIDNLLSLENHKDLYIEHYLRHSDEVISFFKKHDRSRLFTGELYDNKIWSKLGDFFKIDVPEGFIVHANISV